VVVINGSDYGEAVVIWVFPCCFCCVVVMVVVVMMRVAAAVVMIPLRWWWLCVGVHGVVMDWFGWVVVHYFGFEFGVGTFCG
jgi:hypothetical protein